MERELAKLDGDIAKLTAERTELLAQIGKHEAALECAGRKDQADAATAPGLCGSARPMRRALVSVADESLRKTQQAEEDREQKGKPYRDDPLFMYLWERGYNTRNYRANNLVVLARRHSGPHGRLCRGAAELCDAQ